MQILRTKDLPLVTIISGPQGCGKTTFAKWLAFDDEKKPGHIGCPRAKVFDKDLSYEKCVAAITLYDEEPIILVISEESGTSALIAYCDTIQLDYQWVKMK